MKGKVTVTLTWLAVLWICSYSVEAAPVGNEKGKDEFVFLLSDGDSGSNLYSGVSANLEPPALGAFRNSRDSYGNPVPPYVASGVDIEDGKKILNAAGLQFEIPSYASGITEIRKPTNELLPPLASGEVPVDALNIPAVDQPPIELLPPVSVTDFPSASKDVAINEIAVRVEAEPTVVPDTDGQEEQKEKETEDTNKYEGEKYTGGFGGAPGILGEQKEKGYAVKDEEEEASTPTEEVPSETSPDSSSITPPILDLNTPSTPDIIHQQQISTGSSPLPFTNTPVQALAERFQETGEDAQTSSQPNTFAIEAPRFPQTSFGSGISLTGPLFPVQPVSSGADKYTGGFGGAPGVLGNQGKPGFAVQPDGSIKDPDHTYRPPIGGVTPAVVTQPPAPVPTHRPIATPVKYEKYTGGFGGPPGILTPYDKH